MAPALAGVRDEKAVSRDRDFRVDDIFAVFARLSGNQFRAENGPGKVNEFARVSDHDRSNCGAFATSRRLSKGDLLKFIFA